MTAEYLILIGTILTGAFTLITAVLTQRNVATKTALETLQEQVKCLQADGRQKDERIEMLEKRLTEKDDRIVQLEKRVNELERENGELKARRSGGGWK